jgi:uncharacterized protein with GYD domain
MPTYIQLGNYTQKGIEEIKKCPSRLDAAKEAFRAAGGEVKDMYLVMGRYDVITILEAPDAETMAKLTLVIGSLGDVRTETLRVFTEEEYRKIIAALP